MAGDIITHDRSQTVANIYVATPRSLQEFQEQVRAITDGYLEFYMHEDSFDLFIPEAQAELLQAHGLEFRVIKTLDSDNLKVFYQHIPSAAADLAHREEAIKSAILARDGIAAFCLGYNCENEVEDDLAVNGFRYLPIVHLAPQGLRTYLFKIVYDREEAEDVMSAHFERELVDEWVRTLPVANLAEVFGVDEGIDDTDI